MRPLFHKVEGSGDPLVLIPGYSCDHTAFDSVSKELAAKFQLVLLDNRGVGRSGPLHDGATLETMANDVVCLLDHLNIEKAHILGHSMGGAIAALVAYRNPQRVMKVIHDQGLVFLCQRAKRSLEVQLKLLESGVSRGLVFESTIPVLVGSNASDSVVSDLLQSVEDNPVPPAVEELSKQLFAVKQFDMRQFVQKIEAPILFLVGDQDLVCPKEDALEAAMIAPKSRYVCLENSGHLGQLEATGSLLEAVFSFLKNS
jgi:pimeloyl-ACP methyl ester carboxylesterase